MISVLQKRPGALARVFGMPYAGASPAWIRTWVSAFPPQLELLGTVYPGREVQPPSARLETIVPKLVESMRPYLDKPFAIYGHSVGSWVAFEVTRALARAGLPGPRVLVASGRQAPSTPSRWTPITDLSDADFVRALMERYDSIPQAVLDDPELLAMLLPGLRADMMMGERYRWTDPTLLTCPLVAIGGTEDPFVSREELEAWRTQTTGPTSVVFMPGGHFFVDQPANRAGIVERLVQYVLA